MFMAAPYVSSGEILEQGRRSVCGKDREKEKFSPLVSLGRAGGDFQRSMSEMVSSLNQREAAAPGRSLFPEKPGGGLHVGQRHIKHFMALTPLALVRTCALPRCSPTRKLEGVLSLSSTAAKEAGKEEKTTGRRLCSAPVILRAKSRNRSHRSQS